MRRRRAVVDAVDDVSFSVAAGEMVGYVGPNGAGKIDDDQDADGRPRAEQWRRSRSPGWCPTSNASTSRGASVSCSGSARCSGGTFRWPIRSTCSATSTASTSAQHRARLDECIELLELDEFLTTPVRQLSLGQRMRGELTAALLHGPELLFLDEPTVGLDVVSKDRVREFLADLNTRHGTTVLLTTHDLDDIERLCSRLLIIDHGHVIYDGGLDALRDKYGRERTLVVDLAEPSAPIEIDDAQVVKTDGPRQWLRFRRDDTTAAELIAEVAARYPLRDLTVEEPAIEDIVRRIYIEGM